MNPMKSGCSTETRSKNIAMLIREGYEPKQAAAIAYSHARKQGCKVKRKAKRNPPYEVYGTREHLIDSRFQLDDAIHLAREEFEPYHSGNYDKTVVYDAGRKDRGPKGEFVAMFRPNRPKRRRKRKAKKNGAGSSLSMVALLALGIGGAAAYLYYRRNRTSGIFSSQDNPWSNAPPQFADKLPDIPGVTAGIGAWLG